MHFIEQSRGSGIILAIIITVIGAGPKSSLFGQPCSAPNFSNCDLADLQKQRLRLEQHVIKLRAQGVPEEAPELRHSVEQLLEVTGHEDEMRQEPPEDAKSLSSKPDYLSVLVYYVTDRSGSQEAGFNAQLRQSGLSYGAEVTTLKVEYGVRADFIAGASHVSKGSSIIANQSASYRNKDNFLSQVGKVVIDKQRRRRRVVLFVHGFHSSFNDGLGAVARLSSELELPVIPMVYSWPSDGSYIGYWRDEDMVRASEPRLLSFLEDFLVESPTEVILVCHSMGAREVSSALAELGRRGIKLPMLRKVIFAAGDLSVEEFKSQWPDMRKLKGVQFAFYVSDHDIALHLSHLVHQIPRIGDASPIAEVPKGGVTIDASSLDTRYLSPGHSYVLDSVRVGADLGSWIEKDVSPEDRGLIKAWQDGTPYYIFR